MSKEEENVKTDLTAEKPDGSGGVFDVNVRK
jgi:hypothetical protein